MLFEASHCMAETPVFHLVDGAACMENPVGYHLIAYCGAAPSNQILSFIVTVCSKTPHANFRVVYPIVTEAKNDLLAEFGCL